VGVCALHRCDGDGRMGSHFLCPSRSMGHKHSANRRHHIPEMSRRMQIQWAYEDCLRRHGSLTLWTEVAALVCRQTCGPSSQARYAVAAVKTSVVPRAAFKVPFRQTEGWLASIFTLMYPMISAPDMPRLAVALFSGCATRRVTVTMRLGA
jgi:hypothetical protein